MPHIAHLCMGYVLFDFVNRNVVCLTCRVCDSADFLCVSDDENISELAFDCFCKVVYGACSKRQYDCIKIKMRRFVRCFCILVFVEFDRLKRDAFFGACVIKCNSYPLRRVSALRRPDAETTFQEQACPPSPRL